MSAAFVFPGQGSQSIGMLAGLAEAFPQVIATFAEASAVLDYDLWQRVQTGPEERLNRTEVTQPAMLAAGVATWRVWESRDGRRPVAMAGHSLGEYAALVCADALDFTDAVALVAERGRLMQEAVAAGEGAMAAILGLDDATVRTVCAEAAEGEVVEAVNYNAIGQVVIAGHHGAVERAMVIAKGRGAKRAVRLPVSVPSHCDLMRPAAGQLAERLAEVHVQAPHIPVFNNVDVASPSDPDAIRNALTRQLYQPVRWVEIIRRMADEGVCQIYECGPGKVLTGLNKRIDKTMTTVPLIDPTSLDEALVA